MSDRDDTRDTRDDTRESGSMFDWILARLAGSTRPPRDLHATATQTVVLHRRLCDRCECPTSGPCLI